MAQKSVKTIIGIIIFPIFCLLFSLAILRTDPAFTFLLLKNPDATEPTQQLLKNFDNKAEMPEIFNEQEKSHLIDVRRLLHGAYYILEVLAAIMIFCAWNNWKPVVQKGTVLLMIILAIILLIPFDTFFTQFHQLFFPQGNWQFPPESALMQYYPAAFFMAYAIAIAVHSLITAFSLVYFEIVSRRG